MLVNACKDPAVHLAYSILLSREDAEEAAQDAFLKAFTSLSSFKSGSRFSTWFYRILINTALNRKKLKKYHFSEITGVTGNELFRGISDMHTEENEDEKKRFIEVGLQSLSSKERICITLFYLDELSMDDIQQITDLSIANIKVLLHRGRKKLYEKLHQYLPSEIINLQP